MKNFLSLILGVLIGGVIVFYFNSNDDTPHEAVAKMAKPKGLITPAEAMKLDQAYNIKHSVINDSLFKKSTDGGDNRSSWFALNEVETYITYAKNQADSLGYTLDGLRFYLGSYPNSNGNTGLTTVFIIPTGKKNVAGGDFLSFPQGGSNDIPGGNGLNKGNSGEPPNSNYPQ